MGTFRINVPDGTEDLIRMAWATRQGNADVTYNDDKTVTVNVPTDDEGHPTMTEDEYLNRCARQGFMRYTQRLVGAHNNQRRAAAPDQLQGLE